MTADRPPIHLRRPLFRKSFVALLIAVVVPLLAKGISERAVEMAIEMQNVVQRLIVGWNSEGYAIGFGVGLAMGPATVGQIGYEGRADYTAIGNVVNLASRLCSMADDKQILVDPVVYEAAHGQYPLVALGTRSVKGYEKVYNIGGNGRAVETPDIASHGR
jgi:adenylate cyclase